MIRSTMLCAYYARFIIVKVMGHSTLDMGKPTYTVKFNGALGRQLLCELNGCVNCEAWSSECFKKLRKMPTDGNRIRRGDKVDSPLL